MKQLILILFLVSLYSGVTGVDSNYDYAVEEPTETQVPTETEAPAVEEGQSIVIHLTDDNYYETLGSSTGVVLVDFWATWCGPCLELGPVLEEVSAETGVIIYKVDVDECPNVSNDFNITAIPNVIVYKDGVVVDSVLGFSDKRTYIDLIELYNGN